MFGAPEGGRFTHQVTLHVHVSQTEATACFLEDFDTVRLVNINRKENIQKMLNVMYFVCDLLN